MRARYRRNDLSRSAGVHRLLIIPLFSSGFLCAAVLLSSCSATKSGSSPQEIRQQSAYPRVASRTITKETEREAQILSQVVQKKPDHVPALLRLATLASQAGKRDEAARYLREAIAQDPGNLEARLDLGKILFESGKIQAAIETTEEILKKQSDHPDALYNLGAIYGNLGNTRRAAEYWSRLIVANPESEGGTLAQQIMVDLPKPSH